jgi:hypothetical protein
MTVKYGKNTGSLFDQTKYLLGQRSLSGGSMMWTFWGMIVIAVVAIGRGVYWGKTTSKEER